MIPTGLLIVGFGGHARVVADVALHLGYKELIFVDPMAREGESFLGYPVQKNMPEHLDAHWLCFSASGDPTLRHQHFTLFHQHGWPIATLISPSATLSVGSTVGEGSLIAHHAHVGPMAQVGRGSIINTGAVVEHECVIGDFVHLSVHGTVAGRTTIGDGTFLGVGAIVIDKLEIVSHVIIGAGTAVISSITEPGTYVGVPARRIA